MKKHIIYLAAGNSRRFGSNKLLFLYRGKPLYQHGLDLLEAIVAEDGNTDLTVVTQYREILEEAKHRGLRGVFSHRSKEGVSYSIRAGLEVLEPLPEEDYVLFVVADQPNLKKDTVRALLKQADGETRTAVAAFGERLGNPVLFSMKYKEELLALTGDQGGRKVMEGRPCRRVQVAEEEELADIDRLEDL